MSWRRDERPSRWGEQDSRWGGGESRQRSPVWEMRRSASPDRRSPQRDRHRERYERDRPRDERQRDERYRRERYDRRERRDARRSPRRDDDDDVPAPPSPPKISGAYSRSRSRSSSRERDPRDDDHKHDRDKQDDNQSINASPGDWFCKCGLYNFKRRQVCYRRNCNGKRSEGVVYGGDNDRNISESSGITKKLLFRRLDALTTEEKILEAVKERCSKSVLDSIAGITIGRETLTGASKCLAYINFNSIADSTAAHSELMNLQPPLVIDGREALISFYNEPKKLPKQPPADYAAYYSQAQFSAAQQQALSEADRVNAAAAVAQSAIARSAAARTQAWAPAAAPAFVASAAAPARQAPTGDGRTKYGAPDMAAFMYDETSGYYYDPATGLYYDYNTQYFYNSATGQYMYWDAASTTYVAATQAHQNTAQPKLPSPPRATADNTIVKEPEEKKKREKEDKVKVAKKIAKDMERWARTLNQKKENAKSNVVMEQVLDTSASKGSADIGFTVLGAAPRLVRELSPPAGDDFLVKRGAEAPPADCDDGIIDWAKLSCLLCKRKFPSPDVLAKHKTLSELHKQNLADFRKRSELLPQSNGYRDRAAERRLKFGEDELPPPRKRYESEGLPPPAPQPPPSVVDTIGGKMLQKMGWSEGTGLGKAGQGRIAPVEAEQRPSLAGLGQKRGIYTPTPGETYRDTVKKLMIARYKEVVGQEDGK